MAVRLLSAGTKGQEALNGGLLKVDLINFAVSKDKRWQAPTTEGGSDKEVGETPFKEATYRDRGMKVSYQGKR